MNSRDLSEWMWGEALSMLDEAERLRRQFSRLVRSAPGSGALAAPASWEPPVDVIEIPPGIVIHVALPGADPNSIMVELAPDAVTVSALRAFPGRLPGARLHRIEIPYGRFERRIPLPLSSLKLVGQRFVDGCLQMAFAEERIKT